MLYVLLLIVSRIYQKLWCFNSIEIPNCVPMKKKIYIKPEVEKIVLDNTISLQMESDAPPELPGLRTDGSKSPGSDPVASPFGDKPFK